MSLSCHTGLAQFEILYFRTEIEYFMLQKLLTGQALPALKTDSLEVEMPLTKSPVQWPFYLLV